MPISAAGGGQASSSPAALIRVLLVDEAAALHQQVAVTLVPHADIELVGTASTGAEALDSIRTFRPDVVLLSMDLPAAGDGAALAEAISTRFPFVSMIMSSRSEEPDQLRRAMLAGARHFLAKPFSDVELLDGIRGVYRLDAGRRAPAAGPGGSDGIGVALAPPPRAATPAGREGKVFTFYSAKGGAGCTTLACNTAVALRRMTNKAVAVFDCGLLFGDVGVVLNLNPRTTIVDLVPRMDAHPGPIDPEFLSQTMVDHPSGLKVLLAPASPEKAELVTAEHVHRVLAALRDQFDYVIIDTWPTFEERILNVLDAADKIVVPTTLEMPAIKNCKLLLDVTSALAYPPEKVVLVLNRADSRGGIRINDVEQILQKRFAVEVVSDGRLTTVSLNEGVPFVMTHPDAPISKDVSRLATELADIPTSASEDVRPKRTGLLRTVFGG
jgi:pilus assembly protein CpaE